MREQRYLLNYMTQNSQLTRENAMRKVQANTKSAHALICDKNQLY